MSAKKPLKVVRADSGRGRRALAKLFGRQRQVLDPKVVRGARKLVAAVRDKGDPALLEAVRRLDRVAVKSASELRLPVPVLKEERAGLPAGFAGALERAIGAVEAYHAKQVREAEKRQSIDQRNGVVVESHRRPLRRVGVYVPGGLAAYPSTVVMTVVPARAAGVREIAVTTPPAAFGGNTALRYTLAHLGVEEIWGIGGAQAVAAFAYGTETVPRVDKIVGPGNAWVTAAKREVVGDVGIDGLAGPSEVVVVASDGADPAVIAADLLAQAEHDERAAAVLLTPRRRFARQVADEVSRQLLALSTAATAAKSLAAFGLAAVVENLEEAVALAEDLAPEHLQLVGTEAEALADRFERAGAVFVGAATPEVFGDYVAGPSHVLPTGGSARFASGLGVEDFVRRGHTVRFSAEAASRWAAAAATLADAEGLPAHAAAARKRLAGERS
ncbi:MAG: histidinol dehydrogenase [Acidobacteriota bacterium]